ncbi:MAG TPA: GNAT family N-acetyltransferase [Casimicrobiaceae bacterium]|nr:GNAT family N-acetyltransferase [Casimicrobiaceae bacterium]
MECTIRAMTIVDYPEVRALWERSEGVSLSESDTPEAVAAFLARNPGLSAVAASAAGAIAGAVLCGHDGRRGYLHHLAVSAGLRRRGISRQLIEFCFAGLAAEKIPKCNVFVLRESASSIAFWAHNGWIAPTWQLMQKRIA